MPIPCFTEVKYGAWLASLILAYHRFLKQEIEKRGGADREISASIH
jgi:hypothetical protein